MKEIYISTKQVEEHRIVVVNNSQLEGYEQERVGEENNKGNIYKGVVTLIESSLNAVFVDIGENKSGLLPLKEIPEEALGVSPGGLAVGDSILVQIKKDFIGDKGPGLTCYLSLAGHFLVLKPNSSHSTLITKFGSIDSRRKVRQIVESLVVPENMNLIVRTAGLNRTKEELQWELDSYLLRIWKAIESTANKIQTPVLIYRENNLLLRAVRDYFRTNEECEIICDSEESYEELKTLISLVLPEHVNSIRYHGNNEDMIPSTIENQIDKIFLRDIRSPSGVRVVFDSTEALVAIDVNSAQFREASDIEETALRANLEAAEIIALQIRLRNLAGLIVVDFIDMNKAENRKKLENHFQQLLRKDRAHTRCNPISQFGLVEISRQRISRAINSSQVMVCPHCSGTGEMWRGEAFGFRLLRKIRIFAQIEKRTGLLVEAPEDVALFLLNEKRIDIRQIEDDCNCNIFVIPNKNMFSPNYNIKPIKEDHKTSRDYLEIQKQKDKNRIEQLKTNMTIRPNATKRQSLIDVMMPAKQAPQAQSSNKGIVGKILGFIKGEKTKESQDLSSFESSSEVKKRESNASHHSSRDRGRTRKPRNQENKKNNNELKKSVSPDANKNEKPLQSKKKPAERKGENEKYAKRKRSQIRNEAVSHGVEDVETPSSTGHPPSSPKNANVAAESKEPVSTSAKSLESNKPQKKQKIKSPPSSSDKQSVTENSDFSSDWIEYKKDQQGSSKTPPASKLEKENTTDLPKKVSDTSSLNLPKELKNKNEDSIVLPPIYASPKKETDNQQK